MTTKTPGGELVIRPPEASEREAWERLFAAYADFYQVTLPPGAADNVWRWIHDPATAFSCALALLDGRPVGLVQYQTMLRSLAGGETCYLSDLYVDPEVRGHDIGYRLIAHVREEAARAGHADVRLLTHETNAAARRLYDRLAGPSGFILYRFAPDG